MHTGFLIVFDLDGTLVDSRQDLADSTNEVLRSYGAAPLPLEDVVLMIGDGAKQLVERALAAAGLNPAEPEALDRFHDIYARHLLVHTRPYDGVREAVEFSATRATLAVLTNKPGAPSRAILDAFDLSPHFRWVIGGDDAPRKPNPAGLERLMRDADVPRDRTMLIGDSMIDVETARNAAVSMCAALYGFGGAREALTLREGEFVAHAPRDIAPIVAAFTARGEE